jgi:tetratricopeptide (TPR) repeat protein
MQAFMSRHIAGTLPLLLILLMSATAGVAGQTHTDGAHTDAGHADVQPAAVSLLEGLGTHGYEISTNVPDAQAFFDQGLRLYYAFNHEEAIRSFREAQRLDPACSMCWWGEALSWGPNINMPMEPEAGEQAYLAVRGALERIEGSTESERTLIEALSLRYEEIPGAERSHLDSAWAAALESATRAFPEDREISVLYAEAEMTLRPWDYWTADALPAGGMESALRHLEAVLEHNPNHPGACHFQIHAVEQEYPERAVPCAERLALLMPAAGHLVHMPGHIYIRVGRYLDAIEANLHAVHADESYIRDQRPGAGVYTVGYYPHNYDFLAFAASMIGREEQAINAADKVVELTPVEMLDVPGMDFLQHWTTRPLQLRVRFGRWDEILQTPAPAPHHAHATALWHYARGRALIATGDVDAAGLELDYLRRAAASPELAGVYMEFTLSTDLLAIAERVLAGHLAFASEDVTTAIREMDEAARLEDGLVYGEPPEWTVPVRQELGQLLLSTGRAREAEAAFRRDLERFPENTWSLSGLADALRAQGRDAEAASPETSTPSL